jgi:hypothetical protein
MRISLVIFIYSYRSKRYLDMFFAKLKKKFIKIRTLPTEPRVVWRQTSAIYQTEGVAVAFSCNPAILVDS